MHGDFYDDPLLKGQSDVPGVETREGEVPLLHDRLQRRGSCDGDQGRRTAHEGVQTPLVGDSRQRREEEKEGEEQCSR